MVWTGTGPRFCRCWLWWRIRGRGVGAASPGGDPGAGGVRGAGGSPVVHRDREWAADTDEATRAGLGIGGAVPCESTIRQTLQRLDADASDDLAGAGLVAGVNSPTLRQVRAGGRVTS